MSTLTGQGLPQESLCSLFFKAFMTLLQKTLAPLILLRSALHLQDVCITRLPERARKDLRLSSHSPSRTWSSETRAALLTVDHEAGSEEAPVCIGRFLRRVESGASLHACAPLRACAPSPPQKQRSLGVGPC